MKEKREKNNVKEFIEEYKKKEASNKKKFPNKFPFWGRLKISKNRPTLVIDEEIVVDNNKTVDLFVHREATHTKKNDYEEIIPNPNKNDPKPMYLKRPRKISKKLIKQLNEDFTIPDYLIQRYSKNNERK